MSSIFIFVGQCGNQVGSSILEQIFVGSLSDNPRKQATLLRKYFHNSNPYQNNSQLTANAILIDTEPKVVNTVYESKLNNKININTTNYSQDPRFIKYEQIGAGNNWALGQDYGAKFQPFIDEKLNPLISKIEFANGKIVTDVIVVMSAAGGTGSGLGSQIVEHIYKQQDLTVMCILVWPHKSGEVVLQSTNSVFTMTYLQYNSSAILNIENDHIQETVRQTLGVKKPSIEDQNKLIAKMIAHILIVSSPSDIVSELTTPEYKLLNIRYSPIHNESTNHFQNSTYKQLINRVVQMVISNTHDYKINWNIKPRNSKYKMQSSKILIADDEMKNKSNDKNESMLAINESFIGDNSLQANKLANPTSVNQLSHKQDGTNMTVSVLFNGSQIIETLENSLIQCQDKFYYDAFMHHYYRQDIDKEFIENKIQIYEGIVKKQKNLFNYKQ